MLMALAGSDISLATAFVQVVWLGMVLVRRMDCVKASPMAFKSAVSLTHAARSTLLMIVGATKAARMAMTASTTMDSINVQPFRSRKSEFQIPSSEIARRDDFPPARRQAGSARIANMNWSVETPLVWNPAFRRSGPAKAGTPNGGSWEAHAHGIDSRECSSPARAPESAAGAAALPEALRLIFTGHPRLSSNQRTGIAVSIWFSL